jgi:hypothetical protein
MQEFFKIEMLDWKDLVQLLIRFAFNMAVVLTLVRYLYYNSTRRKDYLFTYILISLVIFFMCYLLENIKLEIGFALGLFAIFGIIRYRTRQIPTREMTYLFLVIGISVINALSNTKVSLLELLFTNVTVIIITYLMEKVFLLKHEIRKVITYDRIGLIPISKREELIQDLEQRTGLVINRVEVGRIDFLRDTAQVSVYYYESENSHDPDDEERIMIPDDDDD